MKTHAIGLNVEILNLTVNSGSFCKYNDCIKNKPQDGAVNSSCHQAKQLIVHFATSCNNSEQNFKVVGTKMSFITKFGAHVYKSSLGLLNAAFTVQTPAAFASNRRYHIMTNCRTPLRASGPLNAISNTTNSAAPTAIIGGGLQRLLTPFSSLITQVAGFKVKGRLKRRCKDCYFVVRQQRTYVICPTHPRHKQMSMKKREKNTWILTHATQSKIRPY